MAAIMRSLVSMRTPIISSFSTNYNPMSEESIRRSTMKLHLDITDELLPDFLDIS